MRITNPRITRNTSIRQAVFTAKGLMRPGDKKVAIYSQMFENAHAGMCSPESCQR